MAAGAPFTPDSDGQRAATGAATLASLLVQTAAGDGGAFRAFHDRTCAKLFGIILRILPERTEAEHVLQEVYVTVWRKAAQFDARHSRPVAWAAAIARTCAIDRLRARPPGLTLSADTGQPDHMQPGDAALVQSLDARRLAAALALLDPRHAAAIRACYLDGVSHDVLAQRHGVPVQTVKNWVRRGLIRVRASLQRGA